MAATNKPHKCGSCGGYCGGRRGNCKFAANEAKRQADELWEYAKASVAPRKSPAQEPCAQQGQSSAREGEERSEDAN